MLLAGLRLVVPSGWIQEENVRGAAVRAKVNPVFHERVWLGDGDLGLGKVDHDARNQVFSSLPLTSEKGGL